MFTVIRTQKWKSSFLCYCKHKWEVKIGRPQTEGGSLHVPTFHLHFIFLVLLESPKCSSEKDTFSCSFCEGSRILSPLRKLAAVLPCCMMEVHWQVRARKKQCRNIAVRVCKNSPGCGFPLTIEDFIALERAKSKSFAIYYFKPDAFLLRKKR